MKKLRVGVIGLGKLGSLHALIYSKLKNAELACVCDIDKKRAKEVGSLLRKP